MMALFRKTIFAVLVVLISLPRTGLATESDARASIVLTSQENGLESQQEFTCHGFIHGYIRLAKREAGEHLLESRWISPSHKVEANSRTTVDFRPARSTAYVWFLFPERSNLFGAPDPKFDQQLMSYHGPWHLEVKWDNETIIQTDFKVRCP